MNEKLLVILSPPRGFTSVVSTVIGQHPELYGFPELHLFVGDSLEEVLDREYKHGNHGGPPGVLRTLAQLHDGCQTTATILRATAWLMNHRHWSTKRAMDYLMDLVKPKIGVEKSPVTCLKPLFIERAYSQYPDAYFLHLTRHPVSARKSMDEFFSNRRSRLTNAQPTELSGVSLDRLMLWYRLHNNIVDFTRTLPVGQSMRVKGEDLLSEPERYLPQIAAWMGLRTDREALEAMMHPEHSPYAHRGPHPCRGGNDPKFMDSPALRHTKMREPSLQQFLEGNEITWLSEPAQHLLHEGGLRMADGNEIANEVVGLAECLGYH